MTRSFSCKYEIGATTVSLAITYNFVKGCPATGPTYSSGGEPADPDEVDVRTIAWSLIPKDGHPASFKWHAIENGPLFDLIANDEWLYIEICDAAEEREVEEV